MSKWIKKSNNDPWETRKNDLTGTEPKSNWKRVLGGVFLCAMVLLAGLTVWSAAGGFMSILPEVPASQTESTESNAETSELRPGEDLTYKGVALDPAFLGNAGSGGGSNIGEKPYEYPFTLAEVLEAKGKAPTLELLQKNCVPYVYDNDGNEVALFKADGILADRDDVSFDEVRVTDSCVVSCRPLELELPAVVYLDESRTAKFVMFNDSLYMISGDAAENVSANRYDWQIFGKYITFVRGDDGALERTDVQTFDGTYKNGEVPK